ncbi:MAG: HDIG domain-containing protein [Endomicrobia bacterium]|nr:HDIG domain-containing protein [Endomicrobiia bacterium]MCX7940269.1 HDIG domain-containing protein [Endomicrobiia bacterium]MDW8055827.1 HDIG domain-containing protein [Elusimicrobiota bacterium]
MFNKLFIRLKPVLLSLISKIEQLEQKFRIEQRVKITTKHKFSLPDEVLGLLLLIILTIEVIMKSFTLGQTSRFEILIRILGLFCIIYICVKIILKYFVKKFIEMSQLNYEQYRRNLVIVLTISLLQIVFVIFLKINNLNFYLLPLTGFVILVSLLLNIWWAVVFIIVNALLCVYIYADLNTEMFYHTIFYILSSMYVLTQVEKIFSRHNMIHTIVKSTLINYLLAVSLQLIRYNEVRSLLNLHISLAFYAKNAHSSLINIAMIFTINGLTNWLLVTLLLSLFESVYQCTTNLKLMELANFNHPLLKRLMTEAPGTYHHSLLVASLAETVATKIGLNQLLCKVAGYYHDVGKIVQPEYFIENQISMQNPHTEINPSLSALVIINHVKEGVKLARKYKLGKSIVDIIEQHHGNSVIYGLYEKTLELFDKDIIRYLGPKPQTKEAAIIMICDSCEAACRAIQEPSPQKIKETVERVINTKFLDGQFDEVPLTLRDIYVISNIIIQMLISFYHLRTQQNSSR